MQHACPGHTACNRRTEIRANLTLTMITTKIVPGCELRRYSYQFLSCFEQKYPPCRKNAISTYWMFTTATICSFLGLNYSKVQADRRHNMRPALRHYCDIILSRDVTGHVAIRRSIDDFLYDLNRNQTRILLSFHDVMIDDIKPGSTTCLECGCVDHIDTQRDLKYRLITTRTVRKGAF